MNPSTESKFSMITLDNLFHLLCDGLSKNKVLTVWVLFFFLSFVACFSSKSINTKRISAAFQHAFQVNILCVKSFYIRWMKRQTECYVCGRLHLPEMEMFLLPATQSLHVCWCVCVCVMKVIQIIEMRIQVSHIIWFNAFQSIHSNSLFCALDVLHFNEFSFSFNCWNKVWRWHVLMLLI